MALDQGKLENLSTVHNGARQARCLACAEVGHDKKGDHLRIFDNGAFGCAANPRDREHQRRIWELAGDREKRPFKIKAHEPSGRSSRSIKDALVDSGNYRAVTHAPTKSETDLETAAPSAPTSKNGALGAASSYPYASRARAYTHALVYSSGKLPAPSAPKLGIGAGVGQMRGSSDDVLPPLDEHRSSQIRRGCGATPGLVVFPYSERARCDEGARDACFRAIVGSKCAAEGKNSFIERAKRVRFGTASIFRK